MPAFRVPASTTNLGHGFDCLGIALGFANTVTVVPGADDRITAPGAADPGLLPMAVAVRERCRLAWGRPIGGFSVAVAGDVPIARGMGSSATILCGVAAACRRIAGLDDDPAAVLGVVAAIEGHPDNVTAAIFGGATVVGETPAGLRWARFPVPERVAAVVAIPPFEVKTSEARRILPQELSRADAVRGLQRTALITAALAADRPEDLSGLFADAWHERYRATVNPGFAEARAAADGAGAYGTIISGSGSSVLAFVPRPLAGAVRGAMAGAYHALGIAAQVVVTGFDNRGLAEA